MIRALILDDEPLAVRLLQGYAEKVKGLHVVAAGTDPFEMIDRIKARQADLLFLDVQMPELNGMQLFRIVQDQIAVVLTTAYEEYSLQGFDFHAVDYLLKPVSFERFERAVQRAALRLSAGVPSAGEDPGEPLFVRSDYKWVRVPLENIWYLESNRDYVTLHLSDGVLRTQQSLQSFEEALSARRFVRIHRSYLVSLDKVDYMEHGRVFVQGTPLPIGDRYRAALFQRIQKE